MVRILKVLIVLGVLAVLGLLGYSYSGFMNPDPQPITEPVILDVD